MNVPRCVVSVWTPIVGWLLAIALLSAQVPLAQGVAALGVHTRTPSRSVVLAARQNDTQPVLPAALAALASDCSCKFVGHCTCAGSMVFMRCIADACNSGKCRCHFHQFEEACQAMSGTCPEVNLQCTHHQATCSNYGTPLSVRSNGSDWTPSSNASGPANAESRNGTAAQGATLAPTSEPTVAPTAASVESPQDVTRAPLTTTPEAVEDRGAADFSSGAAKLKTMKEKSISARLWAAAPPLLLQILLILVAAALYNQVRHQVRPVAGLGGFGSTAFDFRFSLCSCFEDPNICLFSCFCPLIRWADTLDKAVDNEKGERFMTFWPALCLMLVLYTLWGLATSVLMFTLLAIIVWIFALALAAGQRQKLRRLFAVEPADSPHTIAEDCFVWWCCSFCAIVQEARLVEEYRVGKDYS